MSANDILDVLNIQRDDQPAKKKQKTATPSDVKQLTGMARELYNLVGPNTPPINLSSSSYVSNKRQFKPSPWSKVSFKPGKDINLYHWAKGSEELLKENETEYFFDKFNVKLDIPELKQEEYDTYMNELKEASFEKKAKESNDSEEGEKEDESEDFDWSFEQTKLLFDLCQTFELKWPIIHDRFPGNYTVEDLKQQFYRVCAKILENQGNKNQALIDSLKAYSKAKEVERKQYLENLLKRTPAEIAEEESLVIEARRFELAAKKMLLERSNLLTLLDSPQATQNVSQYQSSQGISNLYNNLMIYDKHQKKKQANQPKQEPVPPPIPQAASSSIKRDKVFQTNLQQYLASFLKQNHHTDPAIKQEANSIQQLLSKRLTQKEEEAYGLHYHGTEKLTPGVTLRSQQKLPGLQQRQSVLKNVTSVLQEMDLSTAGGTMWKPVMPTRKTMSKYDELLRAVATMLDVKRAKDKLEAEIKLIKSQKDLQ